MIIENDKRFFVRAKTLLWPSSLYHSLIPHTVGGLLLCNHFGLSTSNKI
jgi:hypothetical protein